MWEHIASKWEVFYEQDKIDHMGVFRAFCSTLCMSTELKGLLRGLEVSKLVYIVEWKLEHHVKRQCLESIMTNFQSSTTWKWLNGWRMIMKWGDLKVCIFTGAWMFDWAATLVKKVMWEMSIRFVVVYTTTLPKNVGSYSHWSNGYMMTTCRD